MSWSASPRLVAFRLVSSRHVASRLASPHHIPPRLALARPAMSRPAPVSQSWISEIRLDDWVLRATRLATLHSTAMLGPSHPDTNARCAVMMTRPYKPRDSARSALLTAVRNRRSGLALHPPEGYYTALRPLTGAAEYAWGARCR